ncbi:hypothetical protein ACO1O0_007813 [Amphichorda felina]
MKSFAIVSSLLLSGLVSAQDEQSEPFNLVIKSSDTSLDGQKVSACHEGAAIESLCLLRDTQGSEFYLNTTEGSVPPIDGYEPTAKLVWNLPIGSDQIVSSPMSFYINEATNIAHPQLQPSDSWQPITVDEDDNLAIVSGLDDTVTPPVVGAPFALHNWYVCQTNYGYQYETVNWVLGNDDAQPQNPSCTKVGVHREYI